MEIDPIRIPEDRIGVLIGPEGSTLEEIEERSGATITVDSETGEVFFDDEDVYDPILMLQAQDVVKAIGRGFSPTRAFRLWQDDAFLDLLDLTEYVGRKQKQVGRVKGRIIGSEGKTREHIEALTGTFISIYGKTVGIIGEPKESAIARDAIEMLIDGATHSHVYGWLDERRRDLRMDDLGLK